MLPRSLTKRLVNHARPQNVTEVYAAGWTMEQVCESGQRVGDRIGEINGANLAVPETVRPAALGNSRVPRERSWPAGSDRIQVCSKQRCRSDQVQAFECDQVFVRRSRRIPQRRTVPSHGCEHRLGVGIEQSGDEHV